MGQRRLHQGPAGRAVGQGRLHRQGQGHGQHARPVSVGTGEGVDRRQADADHGQAADGAGFSDCGEEVGAHYEKK